MPIPQYNDFEIAIERDADAYRARVLRSPSGEATSKFVLPFSPLEIENLLLRMGQARPRQRSGSSQKFQAARAFGSKLYNAIFADEVGQVWQKSLILSDTQQRGLRIRLRLDDAPDLVDIPWELLFDSSQALFINTTVQMPLVRALNLSLPPRALNIKPPLKILVVISAPSDAVTLDAAQEWENLRAALQPLIDAEIIALERLEEANMQVLQQRLRRNEYHVLHFIGHGEFDPTSQQSSLLFEDEKQRAWRVNGQVLGTLLYDHKTLRFVYLNACEGALAGSSNPFNGIAQSLLRQGIPAVLAMQFLITDAAALKFSQEVYRALADNYPLEAALSEARKALYLSGNETEWATPVLYLRAPDGVLFDLQDAPPVAAPSGVTSPNPAGHEINASGDVNIINIGAGAQVGQIAVGKDITQAAASAEALTYDELQRRAIAAQNRAEQIWHDTPLDDDAWRKKFEEAYALLERADKLRPDDITTLLRMAQAQTRLDPLRAKKILYHLEDVIGEPMTDDHVRKLGEAFFLHATLSEPPSENLLKRARPLFERLNDAKKLREIDVLLQRINKPNAASLSDFYGGETFVPSGHWNIQAQDMVESRLTVEFAPNGSFQMMQHVGAYQTPINGSWTFKPITHELELQGMTNTFQSFFLILTIAGSSSAGYGAVGSDGIRYQLTRA